MTRPRSRTSALLGGVAAGSIAAIVASLVSLPLESPDDLFFNTFTVTLGSLIAGFGGGFVWWAVRDRARPVNDLWIAAFAASIVIGIVGLIGQLAMLDRMFSFMVILGATVLAIVALLTPVLSSIRPAWAAVLLVAAVAVGIGFAGPGDEESGELSLSDAPVATTAPPAAEDPVDDETVAESSEPEPPTGRSPSRASPSQ